MKKFLIAMLLAGASVQAANAADVGISHIKSVAPERQRGMDIFVWYPSQADGTEQPVGDNALFEGVPARYFATAAEGRFPLIVLSHGSGGNAENLAWLARPLAEAGYIVAAPNHPATTSGDLTPAETIKLWHRASEVSATITAMLKEHDWKGRIDADRIAVSGFSLGGYGVLAAGGLKVDAEAYAQYCETNKQPMSECGWYAKGNIDIRAVDQAKFSRDNRDPRIKAVIAYDPSLVQAFAPESVKAMAVPTLVINFGKPGSIPMAVDLAELVKQMPGSSYHAVEGAIHFSFLGECQPNGKEILQEEGEPDPLCDDGGRPRADIHKEIIGQTLPFLQKVLAR